MNISSTSEVSGAEAMTEDCETVLMQIQYFVARKFELDEELYRTCKNDASLVCSANTKFDSESNIVFNSGVLSCLYRYISIHWYQAH